MKFVNYLKNNWLSFLAGFFTFVGIGLFVIGLVFDTSHAAEPYEVTSPTTQDALNSRVECLLADRPDLISKYYDVVNSGHFVSYIFIDNYFWVCCFKPHNVQ